MSDSRRAGWFIGSTFSLMLLVAAIVDEKFAFLLKDVYHLSAGGSATVALISGIPSYFRIVIGAGSDAFPLFGYRRRTYYAVAWAVTAAGYTAFAFASAKGYPIVVVLITIVTLGSIVHAVIADAVMVAIGNATGTVGRLQGIQQGAQILMRVAIAGPLGGYVAQHWSYEACFATAAALAGLGIALTFAIPEQREAHVEAREVLHRAQSMMSQGRQLLTFGSLVLFAYIFYLIVTPGTNTARFYFSVDVLHFSRQTIGNLRVPSGVGGIAAALLYARFSRRLSFMNVVWCAFACDLVIYAMYAFYADMTSAVVVMAIVGFMSMIYNLSLLTLAARACPPGIEAAAYGFFVSAIDIGGGIGEQFGATIYDRFTVMGGHDVARGWHVLLVAGFAATALAPVFVPFLARLTRARCSEPARRALLGAQL